MIRTHHVNASSDRVQREWRPLKWSGYDWQVRTHNVQLGPGPNWWKSTPQYVSVDLASDELAMSIRTENSKMYCSEIDGPKLSYGTYRWIVNSPISALDPQAVIGLFIYDPTAPANAYREIDIEFSYWSNASSPTQLSFSVHPTTGVYHRLASFSIAHSTEPMICEFTWQSDKVYFKVTTLSGVLLGEHYVNEGVQPTGNQSVVINYWLSNGQPLMNAAKNKIALGGFTFTPNTTVSMTPAAQKSITFSPTHHELELDTNTTVGANGLTLPCTTTYQSAGTGGVFALTNSSVDVKVTSVPSAGNGSTEAIFYLYFDQDNYFAIYATGGNIYGRIRANAVNQQTPRMGYVHNGTAEYWRISEANGVITYATSIDRTTWQTICTYPHTFGAKMDVLRTRFECGYYGTETNPGVFRIAGINIA